MTSIFNAYDEEYKLITSSISDKLSEVSNYEQDNEKKASIINHVGDLITQATQLIQQMELEVRSLDPSTKRELSKKVTQYKCSLQSLKEDYKKIKAKEARHGLLGDRDSAAMSSGSSLNQQTRMTDATDALTTTGDRISAARRAIADTEEVAIGITDELSRNREKIQNTHDQVKDVHSMTNAGGRIVSRMAARSRRQRFMMYAVMVFIILALVLIVYFGLFASNSSSTSTPKSRAAPLEPDI